MGNQVALPGSLKRVHMRLLRRGTRLPAANTLNEELPSARCVNAKVRIKLGVVGVRVVLHVCCAHEAISLGKGDERCPADQLI